MEELDDRDIPDESELWLLKNMLWDTRLSEDERELALQSIANCTDYKEYARLKFKIESFTRGIDEIVNPSQKDINHYLRQFIYEDTDR